MWEYEILELGTDTGHMNHRLNQAGAQGWELVSTTLIPDDGREANVDNTVIYCFMKRRKQNAPMA